MINLFIPIILSPPLLHSAPVHIALIIYLLPIDSIDYFAIQ